MRRPIIIAVFGVLPGLTGIGVYVAAAGRFEKDAALLGGVAVVVEYVAFLLVVAWVVHRDVPPGRRWLLAVSEKGLDMIRRGPRRIAAEEYVKPFLITTKAGSQSTAAFIIGSGIIFFYMLSAQLAGLRQGPAALSYCDAVGRAYRDRPLRAYLVTTVVVPLRAFRDLVLAHPRHLPQALLRQLAHVRLTSLLSLLT